MMSMRPEGVLLLEEDISSTLNPLIKTGSAWDIGDGVIQPSNSPHSKMNALDGDAMANRQSHPAGAEIQSAGRL